MTFSESDCPFCNISNDRILRQSENCFTIYDGYPVTPLHTLIITKRHIETYFDLSVNERADVATHLERERQLIISADSSVTGFNIGMNCGVDAGQTVMHCHIHLIPRRTGDLSDPRGGVRGVIPQKRIY